MNVGLPLEINVCKQIATSSTRFKNILTIVYALMETVFGLDRIRFPCSFISVKYCFASFSRHDHLVFSLLFVSSMKTARATPFSN